MLSPFQRCVVSSLNNELNNFDAYSARSWPSWRLSVLNRSRCILMKQSWIQGKKAMEGMFYCFWFYCVVLLHSRISTANLFRTRTGGNFRWRSNRTHAVGSWESSPWKPNAHRKDQPAMMINICVCEGASCPCASGSGLVRGRTLLNWTTINSITLRRCLFFNPRSNTKWRAVNIL